MLRRLSIVIGTMLAALGLAVPAHAQPYHTQSACGATPFSHTTVRYRVTGGHYMDISSHICTNGSVIKWASQPQVSFPSVPWSPLTPTESVYVSQRPFIYSYGHFLNGYPQRITWRFTVGIQSLRFFEIVNRVFYFRVYPAVAEVCQSGYSWPNSHCARNSWRAG